MGGRFQYYAQPIPRLCNAIFKYVHALELLCENVRNKFWEYRNDTIDALTPTEVRNSVAYSARQMARLIVTGCDDKSDVWQPAQLALCYAFARKYDPTKLHKTTWKFTWVEGIEVDLLGRSGIFYWNKEKEKYYVGNQVIAKELREPLEEWNEGFSMSDFKVSTLPHPDKNILNHSKLKEVSDHLKEGGTVNIMVGGRLF